MMMYYLYEYEWAVIQKEIGGLDWSGFDGCPAYNYNDLIVYILSSLS